MDNLDTNAIEELLSAVGAHLGSDGASAAIVVVGGSTLALRGWVKRATQDVDVIAQAEEAKADGSRILIAPEPLPGPLISAIARVARDYGLPEDWMNTVVGDQWERGLPDWFGDELEWRRFGTPDVGFAGRRSLIALKLHAAVDGDSTSVHLQDLLALMPSDDELDRAAEWVLTQDAGEGFPKLLKEVVDHVRNRTR